MLYIYCKYFFLIRYVIKFDNARFRDKLTSYYILLRKQKSKTYVFSRIFWHWVKSAALFCILLCINSKPKLAFSILILNLKWKKIQALYPNICTCKRSLQFYHKSKWKMWEFCFLCLLDKYWFTSPCGVQELLNSWKIRN